MVVANQNQKQIISAKVDTPTQTMVVAITGWDLTESQSISQPLDRVITHARTSDAVVI